MTAADTTTAPPTQDWAAANQQVLVAELAEVAAALARHTGAEPPVRNTDGRPPWTPAPAAIDRISDAFGLSGFERAVLLMCAGVELDAAIASLCNGGPTLGLALAALQDAHWSALTPDAPLRRWRLIEVAGHGPLTAATLRIDEHVLHHLAGAPAADPKLTGIVAPVHVGFGAVPGQVPAAHTLADLWRGTAEPVGLLTGADHGSRLAVAAHAAHDVGLDLAMLDARVLPADPAAREDLARLLERESALTGRAFVVEGDAHTALAIDVLLSQTGAPVVVSAADPPALRRRQAVVIDVPRLTAAEQRDLWRAVAGDRAPADALVAAFDLDAATIAAATAAAGGDPSELWSACRAVDRPDLGAHAQRVESAASWDDLVVPEGQRQALALLTAHARHRVTVYDDWGMRMGRSSGLGSTAIFAGPSGTGKSFAAEVIAGDLGLDLYRVDLSAVVSKYIGETEKNLRKVFDAADHGAAVLLFDEADALFGKRTEVRDSHDRYANVEVSYLLQRMEAYRGLAILTTNMSEVIDTAFLRRVRFLVTFPFPDDQLRVELWRRAFAPDTPTEELDLEALATLDMSGGTIRNVAVNAAFLAAAASSPVTMQHVVQAARVEASKLGQPLPSLKPGGTP